MSSWSIESQASSSEASSKISSSWSAALSATKVSSIQADSSASGTVSAPTSSSEAFSSSASESVSLEVASIEPSSSSSFESIPSALSSTGSISLASTLSLSSVKSSSEPSSSFSSELLSLKSSEEPPVSSFSSGVSSELTYPSSSLSSLLISSASATSSPSVSNSEIGSSSISQDLLSSSLFSEGESLSLSQASSESSSFSALEGLSLSQTSLPSSASSDIVPSLSFSLSSHVSNEASSSSSELLSATESSNQPSSLTLQISLVADESSASSSVSLDSDLGSSSPLVTASSVLLLASSAINPLEEVSLSEHSSSISIPFYASTSAFVSARESSSLVSSLTATLQLSSSELSESVSTLLESSPIGVSSTTTSFSSAAFSSYTSRLLQSSSSESPSVDSTALPISLTSIESISLPSQILSSSASPSSISAINLSSLSPQSSLVDTLSSFLASSETATSPDYSSLLSSSDQSSSVLSSSAAASSSASSSFDTPFTASAVTLTTLPTCNSVANLFEPISSENPSEYYPSGVLPYDVMFSNGGQPIETNKFYTSLLMDLGSPIWTQPYGMYLVQAGQQKRNVLSKRFDSHLTGLVFFHTNTANREYGSSNANDGVDSYSNPSDGEILFGASEITTSTGNYIDYSDMKDMSMTIKVAISATDASYIEYPLVQGMGFVTAIYHGDFSPQITFQDGLSTLVDETLSNSTSLFQYRVTLSTGVEWMLFVTLPKASSTFSLTMDSNGVILASESVDGLILQAAVAPSDSFYDNTYVKAAGQYVTSASVEGSVDCESASYLFSFTSQGESTAGYPLIFALPHHLDSMTADLIATGIELESTVKGTMTSYLTNLLTFTETLSTEVQFYPHVSGMGNTIWYTKEQIQTIYEAALDEIDGVDVSSDILLAENNYYMAKLADKYAYMLLVVHDIVKYDEASLYLLKELKLFFTALAGNNIVYPLMYDTLYGGVTSTANNGGDTSLDFGAGYYNDHHFHYGYIIHAAAIVGYVDQLEGGTWAESNKGLINALIRDVANPSSDDPYFPISRLFDWFQGHSWAAGLFTNENGKNEESSSEDVNFSYAMKLWGKVIGDKAMESRGDLMLQIQKHSMNSYFLYSDDNTIEPLSIVANKVSGVLYENKIWYNTFFGSSTEYIHGIHMMPITPASTIVRGTSFVREEWNKIITYIVSSVNSGWTGVLRLNQALFDGPNSYTFFSSSSFSSSYLDDGQSRTWSLAFSAPVANALPGVPIFVGAASTARVSFIVAIVSALAFFA